MPYDTVKTFIEAIPLDSYRTSHTWFKWESFRHLLGAWKLYKSTQNPASGFLLLGDTKIRKSPSLISVFGLMSASGIQDAEEIAMVAVAKFYHIMQDIEQPNIRYGSILSDQHWSPLLNDAFILAGIHSRRDFHFMDDLLPKYSFQSRAGIAGVRDGWKMREHAAHNQLADLSQRPREVQVWRQFFMDHQHLLWDSTIGLNGIPRVLARELIGLMTFGYEARPTAEQLSFVPKRAANPLTASFRAYMEALRQAGYFTNNRTQLLSRISHFLFGHPEALVSTNPNA